VGKWSLVSSSVVSKINNVPPFVSDYTGKAGDYLDFKEDGTFAVKEGDRVRILDYRITGNKMIVFSYQNVDVDSLKISALTTHAANAFDDCNNRGANNNKRKSAVKITR